MGTTAAETMALLIDITSNTSGSKAARTELGQLAVATADANAAAERGSLAATAQQDAMVTSVNATIGAFQEYAKTIDVTSASAVAGLREQGDALAANLVTMGATDAELNAIATTLQKVERAQGAALIPIAATGDVVEKMPAKLQRGSNALAQLSQAAVMGTGGMAGLSIASGQLAASLAVVAGNAEIAAAATGIGAIVVVAGLVYEAMRKADDKTKEWAADLHNFGSESVTALNNQEAQVRSQIDAVTKQLSAFNPADIGGVRIATMVTQLASGQIAGFATLTKMGTDYLGLTGKGKDMVELLVKLEGELTKIDEARLKQNQELARSAAEQLRTDQLQITSGRSLLSLEQERLRAKIALNAGETVSGSPKSDLDLQRQANQEQLQAQEQQIANQFRIKDASGQIVQDATVGKFLNNEQMKAYTTLIAQAQTMAGLKDKELLADQRHADLLAKTTLLTNSDNEVDQHQGRLQEIETERLADIARLNDVTLANELAAQKIKALEKDRFDQGVAGFAKLGTANKAYGALAAEASKTIADAVRRYEIVVQAKKDFQSGKSEAAAAVKSLAGGDVVGATLHGLASAGFFAAAAFGAAEAVGSAGGGGGGSAGAGSGGADIAPLPAAAQNQGQSIVVNLYTVNPYSGEAISAVSYELQRGGVLKRPIGPTSALAAVGA